MSGKFMLNGTEYLGGGSGGGGGNVDDVLVNGTTVVDSNKKAQIKSYKEITLQEYITLPDTKLTDGIMYAIKDATSESNNYPPLIYSDNEREVGVWRDGKPLYQKTVHTGEIRTTLISIAHNISNIDKIIKIFGYAKIDSGIFVPLPFVQFGASVADYQIRVHADTTNISVSTTNLNDGVDSYITLQYTKTTDTAGSGTWKTQGGYAHHYSTDEQVIGTWINGETIYEKTYEFDSDVTINGNTWYDTPFSSTNMSKIINVSAMNNIGTSWNFFGAGCNEGVIQIIHPRSASLSIRYLIVQYTKSSS